MRHGVFGRRLGRDTNSRKALLANLASSIIENGQVTTTLAKAKFVKPHVEKLITAARKNKLHLRRVIASSITHKAFLKLIGEVAPGFSKREGGYARIIKLGPRRGDAAPMARLALLEWEKSSKSKPEIKKKTTSQKVASRKNSQSTLASKRKKK